MKKLLLLFVMMLPILANAYDFQADGIFYTILSETEHTVEVAYDGSGSSHYSGDLIIPEQVTKYDQIYTVVGIGYQAFVDCEKLYSITIPKTVSYIYSLSSASAFKRINVDADSPYFVSIDGVLVSKDGDLIKYPAGKSDTEYIIPDGVTTINSGAFTHCNNLRIVKMSNNVKTIKESAFYSGAIEEIILSESLEYVGEQAFGHLAIESITLPKSLKYIGDDAFNGCDKLKSIYIPENVEYIGDENEAIGFCNGMETIEVDPQNQYYKSIDGILYNKDVTKLMRCPSRNPKAEWFEIPETVTELSSCAFHTVTTLTRLVIPSGITAIPKGAFMYCSNLSRVTCYAKTPPSTPIPNYSKPDPWNYSGRENATLYVPKGTRSTYLYYYRNGGGGWDYAPYAKFKEIVEMEDEPVSEYTDEQGVIYSLNTDGKSYSVTDHTDSCVGDVTIPESWEGLSVTSIGEMAFKECDGLTSVTIPNSVTSIGTDAFSGCGNLISITIPNSVTSIGESAFSGCSGLTSVTIPNSVTSIGPGAFNGCSDLTSITIPNSVTSIGHSAFSCCSSLSSVTIPNSVTFIGYYAFDFCSGLTALSVESGNTKYDSRDNCNAIIETETNTLLYGTKNTIIPNTVTSIGGHAFVDRFGLTSITIPNSVTSIGEDAFSRCGLTSITIPSSVTSIGGFAFQSCNSLTSVTVEAKFPLPISKMVFTNRANATLYVPAGSKAAYQVADYWKEFKEIIEVVEPKVKLSKTTATIEKGKTLTLKATVTPSDLTDKSVTWKSSDTKVATVSSSGKVKGVKAGTATITCTSDATGAKATCKVTVSYVKLDKTEAYLEKGKTLTLTATVYPSSLSDRSVTWASSDKSVATVSSVGKVMGVKAGTATITCTSKATGLKTTCKVTVGYVKLDKTEATLEKGKTLTLKATVYPSSLSDRSVTWKSSKTSVATVTSSGKVKGVKAGTATITCTSNATGLKTTCTVNVVKGTVTLNKTEAYIEKGKTTTLKATLTPITLTDKSVTWTSSDKSIATVSSSGKVKGVGYGTATITCTSKATGASATCQVTVGKVVISMSDFSLKKTRTTVLTATLYPTTLTAKSVTWTSSDKSVATVSSSGKVKGVKAGTATITCTSVATGLKGTCTVTVLAVAETRSSIGNDDGTTGIEDLDEKPAVEEPYDVYDLSGRKVANQVTSLDGLPKGIYIVNGKKMLKK